MHAAVTFIALATGWLSSTQEAEIEGHIKYYDAGLMAQVAVNRHYIDDVSEYEGWLEQEGIDGAASLMRVGDIDRYFVIIWPDGTQTRHLSIDCVEFKHYVRRIEKGDIGEVDRDIAKQFDMKGPVWVKVIFEEEWTGKHIPT